jgi:phage FluMu protein Com
VSLRDELRCWWCGGGIVIEVPERPVPQRWEVSCPQCGTMNEYRPPAGYQVQARADGPPLN